MCVIFHLGQYIGLFLAHYKLKQQVKNNLFKKLHDNLRIFSLDPERSDGLQRKNQKIMSK